MSCFGTIDLGNNLVLELEAFDQMGHRFSTLEGMYFKWEIVHQKGERVLKILKFTQAMQEASSIRLEIEEKSK